MTCPDCERFKISAAMWRNKAYELSGTPLPWDADKLIEQAVAAEREALEAAVLKLRQGVGAHHQYIQGRWDVIGEVQDLIRARSKK